MTYVRKKSVSKNNFFKKRVKPLDVSLYMSNQEQRYFGDYSDSVHLFPFRTEKLSLSAPMILQ